MSDRKTAGVALLALASLCAAGMLMLALPAAKQRDDYQAGNLKTAIEAIPVQTEGTVAVNSADVWELIELPGVGETLAGEIIAEREKHGYFHYPEDLLAARGIGAAKLSGFRDWLDMTLPEE